MSVRVTTKATKALAAGVNLAAATSFALGQIDVNATLDQSGDGSADRSAPLQAYRRYSGVTGVQALALGAMAGPSGEVVDFAAVREVTIQNEATDASHALVVGPAAANGFLGDLASDGATDEPLLTIRPGTAKSYCLKPLGAPLDVSTDGSIALDFGANTFSASVVVKGNA